eukprot:scpid17571/ scgid28842/ 
MHLAWYHTFISPPSSLNGLVETLPILKALLSIFCLHPLHELRPVVACSTQYLLSAILPKCRCQQHFACAMTSFAVYKTNSSLDQLVLVVFQTQHTLQVQQVGNSWRQVGRRRHLHLCLAHRA